MKPEPLPSVRGDAAPGELLSLLADGRTAGDAAATDRAIALWRDDPGARRTWHAYQLIGDVLRSDDLASEPGHDAAFVARLRTRLAAEPVVLAPGPLPAAPAAAAQASRAVRRQVWLVPAAAAAGFALVAGVMVVSRMDAGIGASGTPPLAAAPLPPSANQPVLLPNARAEELFGAHQAVGGGGFGAAQGVVRRVDFAPAPGAPVAARPGRAAPAASTALPDVPR